MSNATKPKLMMVDDLLDAMEDAMYQHGKPLTKIEVTEEQYKQLRNDPTIKLYCPQPGTLNAFMGVQIIIKEKCV